MLRILDYRNNPQSVLECLAGSSVYSSLENVNGLTLADQIGLNNESNEMDEDDEFNQVHTTTSQLLETYTIATPAIQAPAISSPYKMKQVKSLIPCKYIYNIFYVFYTMYTVYKCICYMYYIWSGRIGLNPPRPDSTHFAMNGLQLYKLSPLSRSIPGLG
ncbi:hypothetical protein AMTR_s00023p00242670 [Amborella trichopoda]|uniref:Uncharacterized protein n=1 Tax=Amborella trichopoda TaxID=13333 RepID=W1NKJ4_AMBTC|nr:hypothetical protein AMTR_s00023p00242670 [Amborella trichopoda]